MKSSSSEPPRAFAFSRIHFASDVDARRVAGLDSKFFASSRKVPEVKNKDYNFQNSNLRRSSQPDFLCFWCLSPVTLPDFAGMIYAANHDLNMVTHQAHVSLGSLLLLYTGQSGLPHKI